jgi:hypothetical protein
VTVTSLLVVFSQNHPWIPGKGAVSVPDAPLLAFFFS